MEVRVETDELRGGRAMNCEGKGKGMKGKSDQSMPTLAEIESEALT
jgi:hypothetical protein